MATNAQELDYREVAIQAIEQAERGRVLGRPSAFTRSKLERLFYALERGNFLEAACAHARISYRTLRDWLSAGEKDETESTPQFFLHQAVEYAQSVPEMRAVDRVLEAGDNPRFYMADLIWLSRARRGRWAERTADELRASTAPTVQVVIGIAPPGTPSNPVAIQAQVINAEPELNARLSSVTPRLIDAES